MNRLTTLDINKLTPYAVGFDRVFDDMFRYIEHNTNSTGYPPYNIIKDGEKFQIEIALAGFSKDDIEVEVADNTLSVRSDKKADVDDYAIHRGISYRRFDRKFTLADDIVVTGANLENGLLRIELERVVPEEKKPRLIEVK